MKRGLILAVDIGGTKIDVGLVDGGGQVRWSERAATPRPADQDEIWAVLARLVKDASSAHGQAIGEVVACGVGCGGPMTRHGDLVSPLNIPGWRDFPLRARLAEAPGLSTFVDNDAKALALGEGWVGTAAGRRDYLSMVVSTGVGG